MGGIKSGLRADVDTGGSIQSGFIGGVEGTTDTRNTRKQRPRAVSIGARRLPCHYPHLSLGEFLNPKGISAQSPGLARSAYPGNAAHQEVNPNGVAALGVPTKTPLYCNPSKSSRGARMFRTAAVSKDQPQRVIHTIGREDSKPFCVRKPLRLVLCTQPRSFDWRQRRV
jgi:hypothetical protein